LFKLIEGDVTLRSSGIETAVGDGLPLPIGTRGYIGVGFDGINTRFIRVDTLGRIIVVGPDAPGAAATGNPLVVGGVDLGGFVRQIFTDSSGRQKIVGAADNASPVTGAPVLVAGSDGTNAYRLLTDSAGRLQVNVIGSGGTSSTFGIAFPATGTAAGYFDGTNMQGAWVHDLDTGGGTEYNLGVSIRLPGAGGSVLGGTLSNPIRIDPTGTTTQPVNISGWFGSVAPTVGQKTMAASIPVVLPSDQTITVTSSKAGTSVVTAVTGSTSDTLILAINAARLGATIYNNATRLMYLKFGTGPSSASFTVIIQRDGYYEVPFSYTGVLRAVWAAGVTGDALVTELTT
jgi:hypothetical protein